MEDWWSSSTSWNGSVFSPSCKAAVRTWRANTSIPTPALCGCSLCICLLVAGACGRWISTAMTRWCCGSPGSSSCPVCLRSAAFLAALMRGGVHPTSIGVITPYEGQRAHLVSNLKRNLSQEVAEAIEVASVDSFQCREKDYIIFSCVRSNESGEQAGYGSWNPNNPNKQTANIGFLADPRRLNVAVTRAKYGLILIGNPRLLSKQPLWHNLLLHYASQG
ncbi:MAG: hypothetical protein EOP84_22180, partial [Verrucomicrobiaceae bacterium]